RAYRGVSAGISASPPPGGSAMRIRLAAVAAAGVVVVGTTAALLPSSGPARARDAQQVRLQLAYRSHAAENESAVAVGPTRKALPSALHFATRATAARAAIRSTAAAPTFGQPTISGIAGVGFEQDVRLDPTDST